MALALAYFQWFHIIHFNKRIVSGERNVCRYADRPCASTKPRHNLNVDYVITGLPSKHITNGARGPTAWWLTSALRQLPYRLKGRNIQ